MLFLATGRWLFIIAAFLPAALRAGDDAALRVRVIDITGAAIPSATAILRSIHEAPLREVFCRAGECVFQDLPAGSFLVEIRAGQFTPAYARAFLRGGETEALTITLHPGALRTAITVTANRGAVELPDESPHVIAARSRESFFQQPIPTVGGLLANEPGILIQESAYGQVSPFLRGLTGYHVVNLIDAVRFNNSTFRSGPNQYLAFVEPSQSQRVEAVLGPAGAQYGSDALGGAINVLTPEPRFGGDALRSHGELNLFGASADWSGGANANAGFGGARLWWLAGAAFRRHNDLRAGRGGDSRNVLHRLFGLDSVGVRQLLGERLTGTGFSQRGFHTKLAARLARDQDLTIWYQNSATVGVQGYKDLLGGLGRLRSDFTPQRLDFLYARYEKRRAGPLDSVSGTISFNSQGDGSIRQGLRPASPITRERSEVDVVGYTAQATTHAGGRQAIVIGADVYQESIEATRAVELAGQAIEGRPLYPNGSRYRTAGMFGQDTIELLPGKLRLTAGGRLTAVRYHTPAGRFGIVESSQSFRDCTFNTSLLWQVNNVVGLTALAGRGFRAPNLNDLGAIGLNDLGFEIPAADAAATGAILGASAGDGALSAGRPVAGLVPERLFNYEFGARVRTGRLYGRVQLFDAELLDPIVRRTLLFPSSHVPTSLGGVPVAAIPPTAEQAQQGVVAVSTALDPRAVKAFVNDGHSRYFGLESLLRFSISSQWTIDANYSFLAGRDLNPNRPVRRLPPQMVHASLRYVPAGKRAWLAFGARAGGTQHRLSGGDLDDERIGASRRRRDIEDFFHGGVASQWVRGGVFLPTGETLSQIQNRVLPLGAVVNGVRIVDDNTRVPLFLQTGGWYSMDFNGGIPLGERLELQFALMNLLDRHYRVHGSGIDAPGFNAYLNVRYSF